MNRDEFVGRVQEIGDIESREETERAIRATFEILRQRLAGNEPDNLASQLPEDLATPLRGEGGRESFALAEFGFFIAILAVAYVYVWKKGALEWRA